MDQAVPISAGTRARLAVTAERWGVRETLEARIGRCPASAGPDPGPRLLDGPEAVPAPLDGEPSLAGLLVVPWLGCLRCGRVLGRAHRPEPWGDLSFTPACYVRYRPGPPSTVEATFPPVAVYPAFDTLAPCPDDRDAAPPRG